ncbi:MAG: KEOPS complex subunit Cgi121, partial [Candidatus Thermoplasmatota archaeon]|nr:KEOPS complex subunit Cgi121 [Candidatus Thermoplasmatota archaeon]
MLSIVGARFPKGAKCDINFIIKAADKFSKKSGCAVQILDASMIVGREHLHSAILHARRAFESKTNAARSLSVEIARYASGERQISVALSKMGISEKTKS